MAGNLRRASQGKPYQYQASGCSGLPDCSVRRARVRPVLIAWSYRGRRRRQISGKGQGSSCPVTPDADGGSGRTPGSEERR